MYPSSILAQDQMPRWSCFPIRSTSSIIALIALVSSFFYALPSACIISLAFRRHVTWWVVVRRITRRRSRGRRCSTESRGRVDPMMGLVPRPPFVCNERDWNTSRLLKKTSGTSSKRQQCCPLSLSLRQYNGELVSPQRRLSITSERSSKKQNQMLRSLTIHRVPPLRSCR